MRRIGIAVLFSLLFETTALAAELRFTEPKPQTLYPATALGVSIDKAEQYEDGAWIGIFPASTPNQARGYTSYLYIRDAKQGRLIFKTPPQAGAYQLRLFPSYGASSSSSQLAFQVQARDSAAIRLSLPGGSELFAPATTFSVRIDIEGPLNDKAWVGIFTEDAVDGPRAPYISYEYLRGELQVQLQAPERGGNYQLRLFDDSYGNQLQTLAFQVAKLDRKDFRVSSDKRTYGPAQPMRVEVFNHSQFALSEKAWVGIFPYQKSAEPSDDDRALNYRYLGKALDKDLNLFLAFVSPSVAGNYQLRLYSANRGNIIGSQVFAVDGTIDAQWISKSIETEGRVSLYGIYFDHDKSTIKAESQSVLAALADSLRKKPELRIEIQGHTDDSGSAAYNQSLSEQRAQAVKRYLRTQHGVDGDRLLAKGYGESRPITANSNATERARNRRVDIVAQ